MSDFPRFFKHLNSTNGAMIVRLDAEDEAVVITTEGLEREPTIPVTLQMSLFAVELGCSVEIDFDEAQELTVAAKGVN